MTAKRSYYSSSSFKMAALFTLLLGASALLLGSYLYDFSRQTFIQETEAAIDIEIEHILISFENKTQNQRITFIKERSEKYANPVYYYQDRLDKKLAGNIEKLPSEVTPISEGIISFSLQSLKLQESLVPKFTPLMMAHGSSLAETLMTL